MPQDDYKAIHAIADRLTPQLRREFLTAVDQLQGRIDVRAIASALRRGRIRDVELIADAFPKELAPAVETMNTAFRQGGQVSAVQASPRFRETIRFDVTNPEATKAAERNAARLVTNVSRETRKTIREIVAGGFREQRTVDDMARDIRAHIGLTRGDSKMVTALRHDLTKAGTPKHLIDAQINNLIARKVQHRAVTIARTETINSANQGQLALWQQMRADGTLPPGGVFKQWIVTPDDKLCERCGALDDEIQPLDLPFTGGVMTPTLHPRCRCAMGLTTQLPKKDQRRVTRRRVAATTGLGALFARQLAGQALRHFTGKTIWQHLGPHLLGPRRFVGMALPYVKGAARYDGRIRAWIGLHDELQAVVKQGHWTPKNPSPMWEVGVERPLYTPARVVRQADEILDAAPTPQPLRAPVRPPRPSRPVQVLDPQLKTSPELERIRRLVDRSHGNFNDQLERFQEITGRPPGPLTPHEIEAFKDAVYTSGEIQGIAADEVMFHGTTTRDLRGILREGLRPGVQRNYAESAQQVYGTWNEYVAANHAKRLAAGKDISGFTRLRPAGGQPVVVRLKVPDLTRWALDPEDTLASVTSHVDASDILGVHLIEADGTLGPLIPAADLLAQLEAEATREAVEAALRRLAIIGVTTTAVTSQLVRTPTLVPGTYHPDELLLFLADRTGLAPYITGVNLHDRVTDLVAAGTFNQDTRVIALARDTQAALAGYMHTVRTGEVAGYDLQPTSDFERAFLNPKQDPTFYNALVSVGHELLHAYLWRPGVGYFKMRHWATRFMEEGLVENTARRFIGGVFFGGEWGRMKRAGNASWLQQFERAIAYKPFVRELRWYEETFGTEAYYRLMDTPLDVRGEVAVDQVKGWLPTALATHPHQAIHRPEAVARLVDTIEKADYRAVLRLWQDGTLRELHDLSPVELAARFSLSAASARELLKATGAPVTDLSKATEPLLEQLLHELSPPVRNALVVFARLLVAGKELHDLQQAARNLHALWTTAGIDASKVDVLLAVLEIAEAITTAVDHVTGGPLSDPAELIKATHSAADSAKKLLEQLRSGAPDLIDTAPIAARLVAAVRKVVGSPVVVEVATAALAYFTPGLTAVQAVVRVVQVAKGAKKIRQQIENVARDVLSLITKKSLRPDDVWDPDMRPVVRRSTLFWSNLQAGWWTPRDRHLGHQPRPLILTGDGQPRPVGMTWPTDISLASHAAGVIGPRLGAMTTFDYDARGLVAMMVDLLDMNPMVHEILIGDAQVMAMNARAAFEPATGALRFHPKLTNRFRWLMAAAHDPALGGIYLARAEPEHLLDVHTIVHELMHARAGTAWSTDPINHLLEEGLTELYARRYSTALFFGRDYHLYANLFLDERNQIGAYAPEVHSMRVFERAFGWAPTRELYFAQPDARLTIGATLIRARVRHLLDTGQAHALLRGDTEAARIRRAHVLALLDAQPDRAIVGMFFMPLRLPNGGTITLFELWPTFEPTHLIHVLTDAARFLPDLDGDPGGTHLPPFPVKRLPDRPVPPHTRLDTLLVEPTHPTWVEVPFPVLNDLQGMELAAATNFGGPGTWQTIPLARVVTTQRTVTRKVVEDKILDAPPVLGTTAPAPRDFSVVRAIAVGDQFYLADGTHQTVAAWARGEDTIAAWVVEPKRPLDLTPTLPGPRPLDRRQVVDTPAVDRRVPITKPEPRPVTAQEKVIFQRVYAEQINEALGAPLASLDDPLAAIRSLREELKTLPVEVAQAIERDAAHVARYAANPLRGLRTVEPPLDDPAPLVDPFHGVPFGDHTPAAQSRLISFLTVATGELFQPFGSVADGKTSTNDIDLVLLHPTHGMSLAEQRVWWAEQSRLANEAEDAVRAAVARGELTQDQALAQLYDSAPPPAFVGALERLGFALLTSFSTRPPGLPRSAGDQTVSRFARPSTGHAIEVWEWEINPPPDDAEDDGIVGQAAPKITPAQRKAAVAQLAGMVRITEFEDVSVHPLLSRMHPEFDSVVAFATQVADVLGVTPKPFVLDPHDPRLIATQDGFNSAHVRDLLLHPENRPSGGGVTIIDVGGYLLVQDGHHRLIADKLLGVQTDVEVYDLSQVSLPEVEAIIQRLIDGIVGQAAPLTPVQALLARLDAAVEAQPLPDLEAPDVPGRDYEPGPDHFGQDVPGKLYRGMAMTRAQLARFLERRLVTTKVPIKRGERLPDWDRQLATRHIELADEYTRDVLGVGGDYGILLEIEPTAAMRAVMDATPYNPNTPAGQRAIGTRADAGVIALPREDVGFEHLTRAWIVRYDFDPAEPMDPVLRRWHIEPVPDAILHPPKLKFMPERPAPLPKALLERTREVALDSPDGQALIDAAGPPGPNKRIVGIRVFTDDTPPVGGGEVVRVYHGTTLRDGPSLALEGFTRFAHGAVFVTPRFAQAAKYLGRTLSQIYRGEVMTGWVLAYDLAVGRALPAPDRFPGATAAERFAAERAWMAEWERRDADGVPVYDTAPDEDGSQWVLHASRANAQLRVRAMFLVEDATPPRPEPDDGIVGQAAPEHPVLPKDARVVRAGAKFAWEPQRVRRVLFNVRNRQILLGQEGADLRTEDETHAGIVHELSREFEDVSKRDDDYVRGWFQWVHSGNPFGIPPQTTMLELEFVAQTRAVQGAESAAELAILAEEQVLAFVRTAKDRLSLPDDLPVFIEFKVATLKQRTTVGEILHPNVDDGIVGMARPGGPHDLPTTYLRSRERGPGTFFDSGEGVPTPVPAPEILVNRSEKIIEVNLPDIGMIGVSEPFRDFGLEPGFLHVDYIRIDEEARNQGFGLWLYEEAFRQAIALGQRGIASAHSMRSAFANRAWAGLRRRYQVETLWHGEGPARTPVDYLRSLDRIDQPRPLPLTYEYVTTEQIEGPHPDDMSASAEAWRAAHPPDYVPQRTLKRERLPMPPVRVEVFQHSGGSTGIEIKLRGIGHLDLSSRTLESLIHYRTYPRTGAVQRREGFLWVDSALVTEGARGQGIGRWFYEEGLRQALARGYKGIASNHSRSQYADAVWASLKRRYSVETAEYADYFTSFEPPDDDGRAVVDRAIARLEDIAKREALGPTHPIYDEAEGDPRSIHMARFVKGVVAKRDPDWLPGGSPERVALADLLATQPYVGVDRVRRVLEGEFAGTVSVLRIKGELYLSDGHHRVAAASLKDETHIDALVTTIPDDLTDDTGRALGGYAGPDRRSTARTADASEDARYERMRQKLAAGEATGSKANRELGQQKSELDAAREQAAKDGVVERRSVPRRPGPDVADDDAHYERMRQKIAAGEPTGSLANRELGQKKSQLDAARADAEKARDLADVVYYHGTNALKLPTIRERGLVPGEDDGAVAAWAGSVTLTSHSFDHVYLTTDRTKAIEYAEMVSSRRGRPAVIAVRIPADQVARLSPDADDPYGVRFEGTIPPGWFVDPDDIVGMRKQTAVGGDADTAAPVVPPFGPPPGLLPDPRIRELIHQSEALWTTLRAGEVTGGRDPGPLWAGNGHVDEAVHVQRLLTYLADLQGVPYLDGKAGARGINGFTLNSATADDEELHAFYNWDNKWVAVSSELTLALRFFLAQVRDGATIDTIANSEPDTLFAVYAIIHELEHARRWVSPRGRSRYVLFIEEGLTELSARRYATALLFGRQASMARTLLSLADLRARQPYPLVTRATRWYERTFGRAGLDALQADDERMTHLQDRIRQWLTDTAIAAHPDPLVRAHHTQIVDAFARRHFGAAPAVLHPRAVVQLWADGFWETFHTKPWTALAETFTNGVATDESFGPPMVPLPKVPKLPKLPDAALVVRGRYAYSLRLEHDRRVLFNPDNRTLLLGRAVHLRDLRDDVETHTEVLGEMASRHDDIVDKDDLYIKGLFFAHGSSRIVLAISDPAETRQFQAAAFGSAEAAIIAEAQIVTFVRVLQDRLSLPDTFPVHILTPTATLPRAVYRDGQAIRGETTIGAILHPKVDDGIVGMADPRPPLPKVLPPDRVTILRGLDKFTLDGVSWRRFLYHPRTGQVIVGPDEHVGKVAENLRTHVGLLEAAGPDQPPFDQWMRGIVRDRYLGPGHRFVIDRFGSFRLREDGLEDWERQVRALARRLDHYLVLPGYTEITTPIVMPGFASHDTALAAWLDDGIVGMARPGGPHPLPATYTWDGEVRQTPTPRYEAGRTRSGEQWLSIRLGDLGGIDVSQDEIGGAFDGETAESALDQLRYLRVSSIALDDRIWNQGFGLWLYEEAVRQAHAHGFDGIASSHVRSPQARRAWDALKRRYAIRTEHGYDFFDTFAPPFDGIVGMARATPAPQTKGEQQVLDWIRMIASQATGTLGEGGFVYRNIEDLLLQHGQFYRPAALTEAEVAYLRTILKGQKFPMQQCYSNAQSLLWRTPPEPGMALRYHEGWTYMGLIPVRHAWLTLNDKVVDLTMRDRGWGSTYDPTGKLKDRAVGTWNTEQRAYFGLELSRDLIVERMQATDEWHTLLDDFERRWPLLRRPYVAPDAPPDPDDSVGMAWRNPTTGEYQLDRAFREEGTRFVVLSPAHAGLARTSQNLVRQGGAGLERTYATLGDAEAALRPMGLHPRETGQAVYLVQVRIGGLTLHGDDLYRAVSTDRIKQVWALYPDGGVFELPALPKPSKVAIATKPIVDPLMRRAATTQHEALWTALRSGVGVNGDRLWEGAQHGAIYDADAGLYPDALAHFLVELFGATEVRAIEIDSAYADHMRYLGAWDYRHHKLMLSSSTTNDLRVILRKARAAAELNLRMMPEDFEPLTVVLKALETVVHEIIHALDTTPFVSDRQERWIEEGLTELRARRIAMALIFGGQSRHVRNGPAAMAFARGYDEGSYEGVTRAMRWYERTFGAAAVEELWRTGHRVTPMGARLRGLLRRYLTANHPTMLPLLDAVTNARLVEMWGEKFFLRLVPDRPHAGMRPITVTELRGELFKTEATPGSNRDIPQAQIRPWEPPAPRHVFDPDVRTFLRLRTSLVRALNDGRWIVRSPEPTLLRGLRFKQPVSVFQYTEIPFWWADGRTRLRQGGAPRDVEGTYNVAGLIQFMAWHLGVAERLVAIEFSPFITVQGPAPPWSVFTVLPEGSADVTRRVLHVHTTLQRDLAGFLHVVRYADLNEALTYQTHVVALRDIAAALLALEATPAPVEDRWETFLRIGFTELFVQRWGQAILFGHRAPVPDDHRLNRGLDDPGGVFQPLQQPLRWFEQRFGRQAALAIWRGPDRFFRLRDELHRWLLWAFHRHPDPEVQAHAVELFELVRFGPMGNQGWGELESNAVPLFFRGLWEDLDRGKHGLTFWREALSNPGRLDDAG